METSRGTRNTQGLRVYAMHLMELSERSSAIRMAHKARKNGMPFWNRKRDSNPNQIIVAFEAFQHLSQVSVRPTTAISAISTMHQDICNSAERKKVAMIILPFHKHQRLDGQFETTRSDFRHVNRRVLENARCSVGILVDRGLGGTLHVSASNVDYNITSFFFGGHDDHEVVSYGVRMAEHPGIRLNIVRFIVGPEVVGDTVELDMGDRNGGGSDEEFLEDFKKKVLSNRSIKFEERVVRNHGETIDVMRGYSRCNLFLVGRMPEGQLAIAIGLSTKCICPELGPVGNLLISSDFSTRASVLVVQQYRRQLIGNPIRPLRDEDSFEGESD